MGGLYVAALIVGLGILGVQFATGGDDGGADHEGDAASAGHGGHGPVFIFLSLRFWTYAALAFGLLGSLLHFLALAGPLVTVLGSAVVGLVSGALASLSFRALAASQTSSGAGPEDIVGRVGRVLVPVAKGSRGKVRVETRGQTIDFLASSDETLPVDEVVVVVELRGEVAHVARAPRELASGPDG